MPVHRPKSESKRGGRTIETKGFHDTLMENNASLSPKAKNQRQGPVGPEVLAALIANKNLKDSQNQAAYHAEKAAVRNSDRDPDMIARISANSGGRASSSSGAQKPGVSTQNDYLNHSNKRGQKKGGGAAKAAPAAAAKKKWASCGDVRYQVIYEGEIGLESVGEEETEKVVQVHKEVLNLKSSWCLHHAGIQHY